MQGSENMASEETKIIARLRNDSVAAEAAGYTILAQKFTETADVIARLQAQLAAITAERDALAGAAYESAAKKAQRLVDLAKTRGHVHHRDTIAKNIRSLTPAHATAALDHIRAQAKAEGLREAAAMLDMEDACVDGMVKMWMRNRRAEILAAAEKEAGK